jgi:hypothetical protein
MGNGRSRQPCPQRAISIHSTDKESIAVDTPTLNDVILQMQAISGAPDIDPDAPLRSIESIDSLDMMEWLYDFQERYPHIEAQESVFEDISDTTTFRQIYDEIVASRPLSTSGLG